MSIPELNLKFGWKPDLPDYRDRKYAAPLVSGPLPEKVDLRSECPKVYHQGRINSCTANAIGALMEFVLWKQSKVAFTPSRLFIYYNERETDQSIYTDGGAYLRDGMKCVAKLGACQESDWPYDDTPPTNPLARIWASGAKPAEKPSDKCYEMALTRQVLSYQRLDQSLTQLKGCLAAGYPFVFGFTAYDAYASTAVLKSGVLNYPEPGEGVVNGHAVMAVGYDDISQRFIIRNSYGEDWGQKGYFTMPYSYLLSGDLAADFWTLSMVEWSTVNLSVKTTASKGP